MAEVEQINELYSFTVTEITSPKEEKMALALASIFHLGAGSKLCTLKPVKCILQVFLNLNIVTRCFLQSRDYNNYHN